MDRNNKRRLAHLVLGVVVLLPARALAGPPDGPTPHYSSWAYRTPLLYRLHECWHYRRDGGHTADCYPAGPWSYLIIKDPVYIFDPNSVPRVAGPGPTDAGAAASSP
jgi:hypothetical protein